MVNIFKEIDTASIEYISNYQDALSSEVPLELLKRWCNTGEIKNMSPLDSQWPIFVFAYQKYLRKKGEVGLNGVESNILEVYVNWQIALNLALISKLTNIKIQPFKVFDFDSLSSKEFKALIKPKKR